MKEDSAIIDDFIIARLVAERFTEDSTTIDDSISISVFYSVEDSIILEDILSYDDQKKHV